MHGLPGRNIPCDLYLEHLNRICKETIQSLGSNFTEKSLERVGRCVCFIDLVLDKFDEELMINQISLLASSEKDHN